MIAANGGLAGIFERTRAEKRAALIIYLVAGDPDAGTTAAVIDAISPYVDLIELGIPYGDPLADGPTIAAAGQRALGNGMTLDGVLALARGARDRGNAPILFFSYVNPIVQYGAERFANAARDAGALGAIVPDVPLEEVDAFAPAFHAAGLAIPQLVAPTTPSARAARIAEGERRLRLHRVAARRHERRPRARRRVDCVGGRRLAGTDEEAAGGRLRHLDARACVGDRQDFRRRHHRQRVRRCDRRQDGSGRCSRRACLRGALARRARLSEKPCLRGGFRPGLAYSDK